MKNEKKLVAYHVKTGETLGGRVVTGNTDKEIEATKKEIIRFLKEKRYPQETERSVAGFTRFEVVESPSRADA